MILFDTGPLVALCDRRDSLHSRAAADLEALKHDSFHISLPALTEACFHLPARSQRLRLRQLLTELSATPIELKGSAGLWIDVFDWMEKYSDHDPDFADGCLAVLSSSDPSIRIWTYDREFSTIWRRRDASRISLAVEI